MVKINKIMKSILIITYFVSIIFSNCSCIEIIGLKTVYNKEETIKFNVKNILDKDISLNVSVQAYYKDGWHNYMDDITFYTFHSNNRATYTIQSNDIIKFKWTPAKIKFITLDPNLVDEKEITPENTFTVKKYRFKIICNTNDSKQKKIYYSEAFILTS